MDIPPSGGFVYCQVPGVDWPTVTSNATSLIFGHMFVLVEVSVVHPSTLAGLEHIHQSAGGAMSTYVAVPTKLFS